MGKNISYTCDFYGSIIDLDKQVGILDYCSAVKSLDERWTLNSRRYICDKCLEKISLLLRK